MERNVLAKPKRTKDTFIKKTKERRGYTTQLRGTLRSRLKLLQNAELWMTKDHDIRRNRRIILKKPRRPYERQSTEKVLKGITNRTTRSTF